MIPLDPLILQRHLAGLATLEASVRTALRGLHPTYPALARRHDDDDALELTTARMLVDLCNELLVGLNDHRSHVSARLKLLQNPDQIAWPF
jgi:hypothetical protein